MVRADRDQLRAGVETIRPPSPNGEISAEGEGPWFHTETAPSPNGEIVVNGVQPLFRAAAAPSPNGEFRAERTTTGSPDEPPMVTTQSCSNREQHRLVVVQ
jgi:hypothetical protein